MLLSFSAPFILEFDIFFQAQKEKTQLDIGKKDGGCRILAKAKDYKGRVEDFLGESLVLTSEGHGKRELVILLGFGDSLACVG